MQTVARIFPMPEGLSTQYPRRVSLEKLRRHVVRGTGESLDFHPAASISQQNEAKVVEGQDCHTRSTDRKSLL